MKVKTALSQIGFQQAILASFYGSEKKYEKYMTLSEKALGILTIHLPNKTSIH
jgi:hypothetical protein